MTPDIDDFMTFHDATCHTAYRLARCYTGEGAAAADVVVRAYIEAYITGCHRLQNSAVHILTLVRREARTPSSKSSGRRRIGWSAS